MTRMHIPDAVAALERDLRGIFGERLQSMVVYGLRERSAHAGNGHDEPHAAHGRARATTHTLAVVDSLSAGDLRACALQADSWHGAGLATPLLLAAHEFERSLDAFPFEFGAILADHAVLSGRSPFDGLRVTAADLRRACEVQARGHLLHLREGYVETRARGDALAVLIVRSAPAFAALVSSLARLDAIDGDAEAAARHMERRLELAPETAAAIVRLAGVDEIASAEAERLFPPYLGAVERLVAYVDAWARG
jgi:hypothetical protein